MLANVTGNCVVTNVTCNDDKYYVVTWTFHLESSMYLPRCQWLRQIVVMCHIACWFRSGAVLKVWPVISLKLFLKTTLDLCPRKCTYAKVIDLCIMVLWSIGFIIAISRRIPLYQINLCPLLVCGKFSRNQLNGLCFHFLRWFKLAHVSVFK